MAKIQTLRDDTLEKVFLHNSLDAIYISVTSETSILTSEGKIKAELLDVEVPVANGTASGIVYNSDTDRLTITSGGIAINAYTSNLTSATTTANKKKVPTVSAVQLYVSGATTGCVTYTTNTSSSLNSALQKKQDKMSEGFGIVISGGTAVSLARSRPITTIPAASTTVTLEPGEAYIIDATTTSKTLNLGTSVAAGNFGLESHIELFVANTGYIHTGSNVTLIDPLEPDAVNDCTVRFHDGHAIISVEDHVQAYMVQNTSTTYTTGTFAFGLGQTGVTASNYIGFRSELNSETVPTGGRSATNMKHIVGNGMDIGPTITGNLIINSGATIRDIKTSGLVLMNGNATLTNVTCSSLVVSSGCTATLGDVHIPSGATVSVSGGGLAMDKVSMQGTIVPGTTNVVISSGAVIDFRGNENDTPVSSGGTVTFGQGSATIYTSDGTPYAFGGLPFQFLTNNNSMNLGTYHAGVNRGASGYASNFVFSGGSTGNFGRQIFNAGSFTAIDCTFDGGANGRSGTVTNMSGGKCTLRNCVFVNTTTGNPAGFFHNQNVAGGSTLLDGCSFVSVGASRLAARYTNIYGTDIISNCVFESGQSIRVDSGATVRLAGSNVIAQIDGSGTVIVSSGGVVDLTGNAIETPIAPGGGIIVSGGCKVINSAGTSVSIAGGTYTKINKDGTTA